MGLCPKYVLKVPHFITLLARGAGLQGPSAGYGAAAVVWGTARAEAGGGSRQSHQDESVAVFREGLVGKNREVSLRASQGHKSKARVQKGAPPGSTTPFRHYFNGGQVIFLPTLSFGDLFLFCRFRFLVIVTG